MELDTVNFLSQAAHQFLQKIFAVFPSLQASMHRPVIHGALAVSCADL